MELIIYIIRFFANIVYAGIKIFPVQNKITIASRQSDAETDDIRMLRVKLQELYPDVKVVCLCKKIGGGIGGKLSYILHLFVQMWHIGTSRAVVVDSYCISVSFLKQRKSLRVIQMWHAMGALKKFGKSIAGNEGEGSSEKIARAMNMHGNYTHVLASGEACIAPYMEAFGCGRDKIVIGSLPRVDKIMSEEYAKETKARVLSRYGSEFAGKRIVVYAPTFRKGVDISREIEELANAFEDGYQLVIKKHPLMEIPEVRGALADEEFSTLEMLYAADYVICDYSAIVYEAALLGKPLFFYAFDLDSYAGARDFYLDYERDMPGFIAKSAEELAKAVAEDAFEPERIRDFADRYVAEKRGCTEKLARLVMAE